ncbi:hypothetical protein HYU94_03415 [Candidatus Daviesbacteria bacterium]|nr:hypothetical protein [Candidatus Daviesbacteria bacterium]
MPVPYHKIGLGSKILARARLVFGILLSFAVILTIAGVYQGIKSGEFNKVFIKPFKQFAADFKKAVEETPTPSPAPSSNSTSTSTTKVIINQTVPQAPQRQPVVSNCIIKNIREGEFTSNKCYSQQDYEDLSYYLNQYNSAVGSVSFYETKVRINCSNNDFFKTCEQDKKEQQTNLDSIPRYKSIIQGIIAKGQ